MDPADALANQLDAHRKHVLDAAKGDGVWSEVAASYGVNAQTPDEASVRAVGEAIAAACGRSLERVAAEARSDRVTFLRGRLAGFGEDLVVGYRMSSNSGGGGLGLGSIFSNATAHAGWTGAWGKAKRVLKCRTCGAAQEEVRVFDCSYCGGPLFPATEET